MKGVALGVWISKAFGEELKKLDSTKFYGLKFYKHTWKGKRGIWTPLKRWSKRARRCSVALDGACGMSSMEAILRKLGFTLQWIPNKTDTSIYRLVRV